MNRIAFALALATPFAAQAVEYTQVQADKSAINFTYKQMGVAVDGKFKRFSSQISFRPGQAGRRQGRLRCRTGQRRHRRAGRRRGSRRQALVQHQGLPDRQVRVRHRQAARRQPLEVAGQLSIKGKTQDVVVPATFTPQGNSGVFDGSFTIRRADFSIGEGAWAKFDIVANDVLIKFRITAAGK